MDEGHGTNDISGEQPAVYMMTTWRLFAVSQLLYWQ